MKIGTNSTAENTATPTGGFNALGHTVNNFLLEFETYFSNLFKESSYGKTSVGMFIVVLLSMDGGEVINQSEYERCNTIERHKNVLGKMVSTLVMSVDIHPSELEKFDLPNLKQVFVERLASKLNNPPMKLPKSFDYERFRTDFLLGLETYKS